MDISSRDLVTYLRKLTDDIESGSVSCEHLKRINEFYMSDISGVHLEKHSHDEYTDDEFQKFLTLGWYVYTHIIKDTPPSQQPI